MFKLRKSDKATKKSKNKRSFVKTTPSVISKDMNILGNIISEGMLDIHGNIEGNVRCMSANIREGAKIKGDLIADEVQIYGEVEGLVKARDVILHETSMVRGVIMHEAISIEDGAVIDGKLKRTDKVFMEDIMADLEAMEATDTEESKAEGKDMDGSIFDSIQLVSG